MKTILIAGGAGFIGTNLCRYILEKTDNKVICIDNLYSGSIDNVKMLNKYKNFTFFDDDICNCMETDIKIDEIYNLACPASPPYYQGKHAIETTKTCIIGSLNLLELAKRKGAKILFTSTSEIYGEPLEHPQREVYRGNVNTIGVRSCYDEGKRCAESLYADYRRLYNVDTKIVRIFNTYGIYMSPDDGRVVTNVIKQALKEDYITIYGNGSQTRSFCYVDDMVKALILAMESKENISPINLGNPQEFTILDLANTVIKLTKTKAKIKFLPLPSDDPTRRKPDITKAKQILKWKPETSLEQGLIHTIDYIKEKI